MDFFKSLICGVEVEAPVGVLYDSWAADGFVAF